MIHSNHPDFKKTGLTDTSYAIGALIFDVEPVEVIKQLGELSGELAQAFSNWID